MRDRVLGKEEIFRVVWNETSVTDNALTRAIAQIRKALEDEPQSSLSFIETLPTVGYRFIGKLTTEEAPPSAEADAAQATTDSRLGRDRLDCACGNRVGGVAFLAESRPNRLSQRQYRLPPIAATKTRRLSLRTGTKVALPVGRREAGRC